MGKYKYHTSLSTAMRIAGMGRASTLVLIACGLAFSLPYLLPNQLYFYRKKLEKDLNMTTEDKQTNNICTYIAMISGNLLAAVCSEARMFGRRFTLITFLLIHSVCLFCVILLNNKVWYTLLKSISSFSGSGASFAGALYCAEYQLTEYRGFMIVALQLFCKAATLLMPIYQLAAILPLIAIVIIVLMLHLPENPLYLLSIGHKRAALQALERIYFINTEQDAKHYREQVHRLKTDEETVARMHKGISRVPSWYSIAILMLANFTFMFSYYTVMMWYPGLYPLHDFFHHVSLFPFGDYLCDYGYFNDLSYTGNQTAKKNLHSNQVEGKKEDFIQLMLTVSMSLPALVWMIQDIDTLGRKFFIVLSHLCGSFLVFWSYYIHETLGQLVFSCSLYFVITISTTAILCLSVEVSRKRAWSLALVQLGGEIGAILGSAGLMLYFDSPCSYFTSLLGIMVEVTGLMVTTIPPTEGIPLC